MKKNNAIIHIDTSSNKEIKVGLKLGDVEDTIIQEVTRQKAQIVLPLIDRLVAKHKLSLDDVVEIKVHTGPGSFTGLRVGVSIANTLGLLLNIPINGNKPGELVEPIYN